MSPRRALSRSVGAALATATALLVVGAPPAAAAPSYTLEERARAIASPSLVFVEATFSGFLRDRATGATVLKERTEIESLCSGFVVNSAGYVVTSAHCVHPTTENSYLKWLAVYAVTNELIKQGKVTEANKDAYARTLEAKSDFTGDSAGSAPDASVFVQQNSARTGLTSSPAVAAELVSARSITGGDVALLRANQQGLPVVELRATDLVAESDVTALGYNVLERTSDSVSLAPMYRITKITGLYGTTTPPIYRLGFTMPAAANGGMVVGSGGQATGMVNADLATKDKANRVVTGGQVLIDLLAQAQVTNTLGPTDIAYRQGLDAYYAGRYQESVDRFDEVIRAQPTHQQAQDFKRQATERMAIEGGTGGTPSWLVPGLIGVGVIVVVIAIVVVLLTSRAKRREAAQADMLVSINPFSPTSGLPVSGGAGYPISGAPGSGGGYPGMAIPHPAPPGTPVPYPPVQLQPAPQVSAPPVQPPVSPAAPQAMPVPPQAMPVPPQAMPV
ncbi:MAG: hypothetical protein HOV79_09530, partial [Hamadaea sp.]|nr:hypothetical protein [Hamadaea sp.]